MNFNKPPQNKKNPEEKKPDGNLSKNIKRTIFGLVMTGISMAAHAKNENNTKTGSFSDSTKNEQKGGPLNAAKKIESEVKKTGETIEIKFANYFATDKAEISKENADSISVKIYEYIKNLNKDNVNKFINSNPSLNVSCDPRNTNTYPDGNRGLAQARAEESQKIIRNIIKSFNFSNSELTPDQIKQVIEKFSNLNFNIPENGVIDYHAVATEAEWEEAKTNETKRLKIYQDMRFVNAEFIALNTEKPNIKIETGGGIFEVGKYGKVFLVIDQSPSMKESKTVEKIIKHLSESKQKDIPTRVVGYTNKINNEFDANNLVGGAEVIKDMKFVDENRELTIDVLIELLKKQERNEVKGVAYVLTDEKLQNISRDNLDALIRLSTDKNIDLMFTVNLEGNEFQLPLEEIQNIFNKKYGQEELTKRKLQTEERIKQLNKVLKGMEAELTAGNNNRRYLNELKKGISETKELISINQDNLKKYGQIDIDYNDFVNAKKNIKETGKDYSGTPNTTTYPGADIVKGK